jgi:cytochrome o ubiquinol oxidase subunit IV
MSESHTHSHHNENHEHDAMHADHGSFKSYVTGFILAVILTAIPFALVMGNVFDKSSTTGLILLGLAAVQIIVHMVYFLHMNTRSEGGWSMLALVFTVMLVVIMMSGSIWVMYHMNHNMMPGMMNESTLETRPESIRSTSQPTVPGDPAPAMESKQ